MKKTITTLNRITKAGLIIGISCLTLIGCSSKKENNLMVTDRKVMHETEFGGVYVDMTIDEFNSIGFEFGDSVDIAFSNGYRLDDIPYYNGYYTKDGYPLIVGYPGYPYIDVAISYGDSMWEVAGLSEGDTATITLHKKGEYLDVQNARNLHYSDERSDYASDMIFANFRSIVAGDIAQDRLYRSASPCDNQHNRAGYADALCREASIGFILNLADTEERVEGYISSYDFNSPYFLSLYNDSNVILCGLNTRYHSKDFMDGLSNGLRELSTHEGPYLVHCTEGKDRTGFICIVLESLCGASYYEILNDYMITYENYYGVTRLSDPAKFDILSNDVFVPLIRFIIPDEEVDPKTVDLKACAEEYLRTCGMTDEEIEKLRSCLVD